MSHNASPIAPEYRLVHDLLAAREASQPEEIAYTFLQDGEQITEQLTYRELGDRSRKLARYLQARGLAGERCLILLNSSIDYVIAFLGCILAGAVAVPAYPPRPNKTDERLRSILIDSGAKIIIAAADMVEKIPASFIDVVNFSECEITDVDSAIQRALGLDFPAENHQITEDSIAYLQYTSGSTGNPKGVMVSHRNLLRNIFLIKHVSQYRDPAVHVTWLPIFHDFGLVNGICHPLYVGQHCVFMPPAAFTQNPMRWLKAMSDFGGSVSGAPNFAYEYCIERATEEDMAELDLSAWEVAFSGAEPVRPDTINAFVKKFSPCGLAGDIFCPAYGLAEATLYVSTIAAKQACTVKAFDKLALEKNKVIPAREAFNSRNLVACGSAQYGQKIIIVDPDSCQLCDENKIGEIWVCDTSIPSGYWNKPTETEETFLNYIDLPDGTKNAGPFLRTGDIGFLDAGELFIVSRLKDLIIIRGTNHYPQDIELTVETAHEALRVGGVAAFSVLTPAGDEGLVIVQELERQWRKNFDGPAIAECIRRKVAENHNLEIHELVLISPASIAKTTSGKIQRRLCRAQFLADELATLYHWKNPAVQQAEQNAPITNTRLSTTTLAIIELLKSCIAKETGRASDNINLNSSFADFGLGSLAAVRISGELERKLNIRVSPTCAYDYPTLPRLAEHLINLVAAKIPENKKPDATLETRNHSLSQGNSSKDITEGDIAIVGLSCRFPGSDNADEFWQLLKDGRQAITTTETRWQPQRGTAADFAGLINNVEKFDAGFFGIPTREAIEMDPQQRLLLELSWEALETAGIPPGRLSDTNTGVFIGVSTRDYSQLYSEYSAQPNAFSGSGNAASICANRLSYFYNLHGPSLAVDTACSSSLVALHQACNAIKRGECSMAIVGGVNLIFASDLSDIFTQANMLSHDGQCKTFDADANGYVRGEGCGVIVIKPLAQAVENDDPILAIIRGSAINQDGRTNGLTAPNGLAQRNVIKAALDNAKLTASDISYLEAHGTGTPLGDPIEFNSLAALRDADNATQPCFIGSVKTNIGHLEAAAGMAGLIKVVLSLQHELIPQHCNFQQHNPLLTESSHLKIASSPEPWPRSTRPRNAGVSSFGFGGTNAHVILAEAPRFSESQHGNKLRPQLVAVSAKSPQALTNTIANYIAWAGTNTQVALEDVSYTSLLGRDHFDFRTAVVVAPHESIPEKLASLKTYTPQKKAHLVWLFSGQGSQYARMGEDMLQHSSVYAHHFNQCSLVLEGLTGKSLQDCLYGPPEKDSEFLSQPVFTQAAIFSVEYALAKTYENLGVTPDLLLGHSIGEYVAAAVAGIFSAEDALKMLVYRARALESLSNQGGMLAIETSREELQTLLAERALPIDIAACNGFTQQVVSASIPLLEELASHLAQEHITCEILKVTHAFHSRLLEPIAQKLLQFFNSISFAKPQVAIISSKTGQLVTTEMSCASYWVEQMLMPVEFSKAIATIMDKYETEIFLEIGAKPTLLGVIKQDYRNAVGIPAWREKKSAYEQWLHSIANLYCHQVSLDFKGLFEYSNPKVCQLPHYGFERNSYWLAAEKSTPVIAKNIDMFPLEKLSLANAHSIYFNLAFGAAEREWIKHHQLFGKNLFPATGYIELLVKILNREFVDTSCELRNLVVAAPLFVDADQDLQIQIEIQRTTTPYQVNCYSSFDRGQSWQLNVALDLLPEKSSLITSPVKRLEDFKQNCAHPFSIPEFYQAYEKSGLNYGQQFQLIESLLSDGGNKFIAYLKPASRRGDMVAELLDACAQMLGGCASENELWLPVSFDSLKIHAPLHGQLVSIAEITYRLDTRLGGQVAVYADEKLLLEIDGLQLAKAKPEQFLEKSVGSLSYKLEWYPVQSILAGSNIPEKQRQVLLLGNNTDFNFTMAETLRGQQISCEQYFLSSLEAPAAVDQVVTKFGQRADNEKIILINCLDYSDDQLAPDAALQTLLNKLVPLLKHIISAGSSTPFSVALLARNATYGEGDIADNQGLVFSALCGLVKTLNAEYVSQDFCLIDLCPQVPDTEQCEEVLLALRFIKQESLVRVRHNKLSAQRLIPQKLVSHQKTTPTENFKVAPDGWHLVSGGLGDLGFATAEWLIDQGARYLILLGRSAPSEVLLKKIAGIQATGINLILFSADVGLQDSLKIVFDYIKGSGLPLRGIVQAAGTLYDSPFAQLTLQDFAQVMTPKVAGTLNLYHFSRDYQLDYFVCYSSIASVLGTQAQANYATANAFLDYFVHVGRQGQMPVSAINWGPWGDYGMAVKSGVLSYAKARGINALGAGESFPALARHLTQDERNSLVVNANWEQFYSTQEKPNLASLFHKLLPLQDRAMAQADSHQDVAMQLLTADMHTQKNLLLDYLHQLINSSFGDVTGRGDFAELVPAQLGMDSLMSIELRNIIKRNLSVDVPVQMFVSGSTISEIINFIIDRLALNHITSSSEQSLTEVEEFTL